MNHHEQILRAMSAHPSTLTSNPHHAWGPHLRLIGMALLWGASWPAGRAVAQHMPPLAAASLRFLLAAVVLLPWLYSVGGMAQLRNWRARRWLGMAAAGATGVFGYAAFFLMGLQHLPAGKAALVITLNPVLTLALAAWLFRERLNRPIAAGMALAVCGAVLVISHGEPAQLLTGAVGVGELLILGCVVCWATYTLIGRWMLTGVDALSTTAMTSVIGALMLLAASLLIEGPAGLQAAMHGGITAWGALLFLAFGATALAYAWYFDGVKALGAGAASGYITLVPVIGVLLSALWLGERMDASILLGGGMAVAGTAVMNWGRSRPVPAKRS
jgi:drug/metabolite transporter (DMT)-like permease